jgi:short-subunit dehydrogenase
MVRGRVDLPGALALVTGAGSGIGRSTALLLAERGASVLAVDIDEVAAERTAAECRQRASAIAGARRVDVADRGAMEQLAAEVHGTHGPLDVLVNNAGIMPLGSVLKEPDHVARAIIDVNVHGIINGTKAVAPGMADRGHGHIVNVASAVGRIAVAEGATYSASKFAAVGFSEATRAELKPHGIDVSVVLPTIVRTELAAGVPTARGVKAVSAEDVAEVIATAIRTAHPELWVPRWVQGMTKATGVLPRWLQERIAGAFGADRVLADRDETQRATYEARVRPPAG